MDRGQRPDKGEVEELTKEFIAESQEGLERMELCLTELEKRPGDGEVISEIFRAVHTIKGTTGFLGFARLEKLAHAGEGLLGALRDGKLAVTTELISGLLQLMDGLRRILQTIETTGTEGEQSTDNGGGLIELLLRLKAGEFVAKKAPPKKIEMGRTRTSRQARMRGTRLCRLLPEKSRQPAPQPRTRRYASMSKY